LALGAVQSVNSGGGLPNGSRVRPVLPLEGDGDDQQVASTHQRDQRTHRARDPSISQRRNPSDLQLASAGWPPSQ